MRMRPTLVITLIGMSLVAATTASTVDDPATVEITDPENDTWIRTYAFSDPAGPGQRATPWASAVDITRANLTRNEEGDLIATVQLRDLQPATDQEHVVDRFQWIFFLTTADGTEHDLRADHRRGEARFTYSEDHAYGVPINGSIDISRSVVSLTLRSEEQSPAWVNTTVGGIWVHADLSFVDPMRAQPTGFFYEYDRAASDQTLRLDIGPVEAERSGGGSQVEQVPSFSMLGVVLVVVGAALIWLCARDGVLAQGLRPTGRRKA